MLTPQDEHLLREAEVAGSHPAPVRVAVLEHLPRQLVGGIVLL